MRAALVRPGVLTLICFTIARSAALTNSAMAAPEAVAAITQAKYCFARQRGLDPGHLPPAYLVLQLRIGVSYRNTGVHQLIVPLERERSVYTALKPGWMSKMHEGISLFEPVNKPIYEVPAELTPDKKNDLFTLIPARGEMTPAPPEEVTLPVDRRAGFKPSPDLRGHRVYLRLKFEHQPLAPALEIALSDRWTRFGMPWTGTLMTNTVMIDVPEHPPQALPCVDEK